jgi:hypothetical protein
MIRQDISYPPAQYVWKDLDFWPNEICYVYWPATLSGRSSTGQLQKSTNIGITNLKPRQQDYRSCVITSIISDFISKVRDAQAKDSTQEF